VITYVIHDNDNNNDDDVHDNTFMNLFKTYIHTYNHIYISYNHQTIHICYESTMYIQNIICNYQTIHI